VLSYHRERGLVLHLNFSSDFKTAANAIHNIRGIPTVINEKCSNHKERMETFAQLSIYRSIKRLG